MTLVAGVVALAAALALAASFGGALHPAGDSLAVFRVPLALVLVPAAWAALGPAAGGAALLGGLLVLGPQIAAMRGAADDAGALRHYQKNLRHSLATPEAVLADIAATDPATITLQEVSDANRRRILDALRASHPHQAYCPAGTVGGVAVASRWPALEVLECGAIDFGGARGREGDGLTALRVDTPGGPLWIASVHLTWPWPMPQARQVAALAPRIARLEGDVLLAGDFNMMRWGRSVRALRGAARAQALGPARATFVRLAPPLPLRLSIDHAFVPRGARGRTERRPRAGSDHHGLLVRWAR